MMFIHHRNVLDQTWLLSNIQTDSWHLPYKPTTINTNKSERRGKSNRKGPDSEGEESELKKASFLDFKVYFVGVGGVNPSSNF